MADDYKKAFGEELFNLFARFLNNAANREFLDSIRGEYGVLWYLLGEGKSVTVGQLSDELHVVPGRMTDILKSLEKKGMIRRSKSEKDKRVVEVSLLEAGEREVLARRAHISEKYEGLTDIFTKEEAEELLRLAQKLLTFKES